MAHSLSQREAAELVLASTRAWEGWESDAGAPSARAMPAGVWFLFRLVLVLRQTATGRRAILEAEKLAAGGQ